VTSDEGGRTLGSYEPGAYPHVFLAANDPDWLQQGTSTHELVHQALAIETTYGHAQSLLRYLARSSAIDEVDELTHMLLECSLLTQEGAAAWIELIHIRELYGDYAYRTRLHSFPYVYAQSMQQYAWLVDLLRGAFLCEAVVLDAVSGMAHAVLSTSILEDESLSPLTIQTLRDYLSDVHNHPDARLLALRSLDAPNQALVKGYLTDVLSPLQNQVDPDDVKLAVSVGRAMLQWVRDLNMFPVTEPAGRISDFPSMLDRAAARWAPGASAAEYGNALVPATKCSMRREVAIPVPDSRMKGIEPSAIALDDLDTWYVDHRNDAHHRNLAPTMATALGPSDDPAYQFQLVFQMFCWEMFYLDAAPGQGSLSDKDARRRVGIRKSAEGGAACTLYMPHIHALVADHCRHPDAYGSLSMLTYKLFPMDEFFPAVDKKAEELLEHAFGKRLFIYSPVFALGDLLGSEDKGGITNNGNRTVVSVFRDLGAIPNAIVVSDQDGLGPNHIWFASERVCALVEDNLPSSCLMKNPKMTYEIWGALWQCSLGAFRILDDDPSELEHE
jgi:hypothetical protein